MKSLIALLRLILEESGIRCGTSTIRDLKRITERLEHEGLSFLTITLPKYCQDFERSLDQGFVSHAEFLSFEKSRGLPQFLGGFLDLVFDRKTGRLLNTPDIEAIRSIRQITLLYGKILLPCTSKRRDAAMSKYVECEQDVRLSDEIVSSETNRFEEFHRISQLLWRDFLYSVDVRIYNEGIVPKHGPGSTADKLRGNAKYNQATWTVRMESLFPHWEQLLPSESFLERSDGFVILEPADEIPVKVISVPKTLKTPRIIAIEPTCMQYMQQGVLDVIVQEMSRSNHTRHFVVFESQEPNQRLAREGSITGALATLDLSEASDRVSNQHVRLLLSRNGITRDAVDACRSRKADVPGHGILSLSKFASMGSALCFPFEALVFTTIVFIGIERVLNRRLTKKDIESFYGLVRVYGDDIIVPVEFVPAVIEELEAFGLRVNAHKSFWTGKFRESCGAEYYDGEDVHISRCRRILPVSRQNVEELISAVSLRNQLFHAGYVSSVDYLDRLIGSLIPFPYVESSSVLLGRHYHEIPSQDTRYDPGLQLPLVKGMRIETVSPISELDDYGALLKWFLKRGSEPFANKDHLHRSGRPVSARIKTRWAPPF